MLNTFSNPEFRLSEQNFSKKMVRIKEVWLYDINHELDISLKNFSGLNTDILYKLQQLMHEINPYAKKLKIIFVNFMLSEKIA